MLLEKDKPAEDSRKKACDTWAGSDFSRGECEDPYYQLCFGNTDPLDPEFERISEEILEPLIVHQKEIEE